MYIFYEQIWVCCGCDVIVVYDVVDRQIKMIHSISANSIESYIVMHSGQNKSKMSDIETDDSYWGFGRYCEHGDIIV